MTLRALACVAVLAAPLPAQRPFKQPPDRILEEELAMFGQASVIETIHAARPRFLMADETSIDRINGHGDLKVFIGERSIGDTTVLVLYKASELKEIRWFREGEASHRFGLNRTTVILLTPKEGPKKKP